MNSTISIISAGYIYSLPFTKQERWQIISVGKQAKNNKERSLALKPKTKRNTHVHHRPKISSGAGGGRRHIVWEKKYHFITCDLIAENIKYKNYSPFQDCYNKASTFLEGLGILQYPGQIRDGSLDYEVVCMPVLFWNSLLFTEL